MSFSSTGLWSSEGRHHASLTSVTLIYSKEPSNGKPNEWVFPSPSWLQVHFVTRGWNHNSQGMPSHCISSRGVCRWTEGMRGVTIRRRCSGRGKSHLLKVGPGPPRLNHSRGPCWCVSSSGDRQCWSHSHNSPCCVTLGRAYYPSRS